DGADRARQAARILVNQRHRLAGEDVRRIAACGADARGDVGGGVGQVERFQLASERDPLLQLPQTWLLQTIGELRLSGEDHRQQLAGRRFQVREQADLLEDLVGDRLRLVYDQRRRLPARLPGTNRRLEAAEQRRL